ncbi:MAG: fluoride efflux transporter CrcB [Spirochaetaceae bacterium]|nr:fluoride efflux transporter CrcB [Spirochaetaceae bacterium]
MNFLFVAVGGALGAALRHAAVLGIRACIKTDFPLPILLINIAGAFIIGFASQVFSMHPALNQHRLFIITGLLGGWTTFSSYALETVQLFQKGSIAPALAYIMLSNLLCFLFVLAGMSLSKWIFGQRLV